MGRSPAIPWSMLKSLCLTAAITMSIPRKSLSKLLARWHLRQAARKANPVLLEPIMSVEVVVPEDLWAM